MSEAFAPDRPEFFLGDPHGAFRRLRREDPLPWYAGSARLEARVAFEELLARHPDFELAGEPELLHSRLMHGVERLPVRLRGRP